MSKTWMGSNGKEKLIADMSDAHIHNAMRKIRRENKDYATMQVYIDLNDEITNRKNKEVDKFNSKELNEIYKKLHKELGIISRDDIYGDMQYEIKKAQIEGFIMACEIIDTPKK